MKRMVIPRGNAVPEFLEVMKVTWEGMEAIEIPRQIRYQGLERTCNVPALGATQVLAVMDYGLRQDSKMKMTKFKKKTLPMTR